MNNRYLIKLAALLVSVCYIVAFLGFDVHNCSDDGRVYVGFLANGISCENLHPDTPCHHHDGCCCCCQCEDDGCEDGEDCCSDSIQRITLPGSGDDTPAAIPAPVLPLMAEIITPAAFCEASVSNVRFCEALKLPPPDLSLFCNYRA